MRISSLPVLLHLLRKFSRYDPCPVTFSKLVKYLLQFPSTMHDDVISILQEVRFVSLPEAVEMVSGEVRKVIARALVDEGILESEIVIVPAHREGTSSHATFLSLQASVKGYAPQVRFYDDEPSKANKLFSIRRRGCLIFVDDFIGSGQQFSQSFKAWSGALAGRSVAFVLVTAVACSEGIKKIEDRGARVEPSLEHQLDERFWAVCKSVLNEEAMRRLIVLACELQGATPFGHENGGCMVVLERNCPNNVPMILRGTRGQRVWRGLFPRQDELVPAEFSSVVKRLKMPNGLSLKPYSEIE